LICTLPWCRLVSPGPLTTTTTALEELTGRDLSRLDDQVDFFLALRVR